MTDPQRPLVALARRFQTTFADHSCQACDRLAETLEPMIRTAIRTGLGQPPLVAWVQAALCELPAEEQDAAELAGPLAHALSQQLMARAGRPADHDTVTGP